MRFLLMMVFLGACADASDGLPDLSLSVPGALPASDGVRVEVAPRDGAFPFTLHVAGIGAVEGEVHARVSVSGSGFATRFEEVIDAAGLTREVVVPALGTYAVDVEAAGARGELTVEVAKRPVPDFELEVCVATLDDTQSGQVFRIDAIATRQIDDEVADGIAVSFATLNGDITLDPMSDTTADGEPASTYLVVPDGASVVVLVRSGIADDVIVALPDDRSTSRCD